MAVFAQSCTFGAMRAQVDGGIKHGLLAHPDAVFNNRIDRTTHGAVGAHGAFDFDFSGAVASARTSGIGFFDQTQLGSRKANTNA